MNEKEAENKREYKKLFGKYRIENRLAAWFETIPHHVFIDAGELFHGKYYTLLSHNCKNKILICFHSVSQ